MKINFINQTKENIIEYKKLIREIFKFDKTKTIMNIIFVNDEEIHKINKDYRNIDRVTDVISFALEDNNEKVVGDRILGDIYLCIPRMKEQAKEYNHSEKRELSFLVCHGLLHLLGYDHVNNKEEEKVMFDLQDEILDSLNITR